ncbi:DUF222 domain-containing protein, partial [Gordonia sp. (in: high G+C Gram-positive bacteria)]
MDLNQAVAELGPAELAELAGTVATHLAGSVFTASTEGQLLETAEILERANRRFDGATSALLAEISDRSAYRKAGFLSLHAYLAGGLRLGDGEAKRRRITGAGIARLANLQGETLAPVFPATAEAVADGAIGADHVVVIDEVMRKIPSAVDPQVRAGAESRLAEVARDLTPA